jgi:hypothetical protein
MVQIKIERIGDDVDQTLKFWTMVTNDLIPGLGDITFGKKTSRAWCAEIVGIHPKYKFKRKFLIANRDYSHSNKGGSRGIYDYFNLENKHIYEISSPISWKSTDRFFCKIENNQLIRITKEEAEECLKNLLE